MSKKILENPDVYEVELLSASDKQLKKISMEKSLGLSLEEIKKVRDYFKKENRNPSDIELEAFAQSWSEHCCYKSSRPILKRTVFKVKAPQNICVISEDAGVVDFDKDHAYVVALESHNHPSALDPYGGSATGIGGILRDVVCMGAQPIALVDPIFFGPLDYDKKKLPKGVKHPRFLFHGVVDGIGSYGNRVGIPTVAGQVTFDESYVGNCLVNVGCVGILNKKDLAHSRAGNAGDVYIYAGGKTGRDGIHGVTFASAELHEASDEQDRPAVQLGYAIMKEPLMHATLEVNEKKLATGIKDFGGGGLSCVAAEMAHAAGLGGTIELDKIPLKEEGLSPWEIWVSESQERMMLSVKPSNVGKVLEIFDFWDVPAFVVGNVDDSNRIKGTFKGTKILDLELEFLTQGVVYERKVKHRKIIDKIIEFKMPNLLESGVKLIGMPNIASKESVIRRYDNEVRANTILKPMQGKVNYQTHGDAAVIKPLDDSYRGLAITADVNPMLCREDPYWGAASAVEEVVRNLVAVNALPHSMADCLNFGNPEKPEALGDFLIASEGLYDVAREFKVPFVSGNVSLYNESVLGAIAPTPTLLGVGIVEDVRKAVTSDLKNEGNLVYLIGETKRELRGSHYYKLLGKKGGIIPKVDAKKTKIKMTSILKAMKSGLIESCHDPSEGGLFVALAEMCFGGALGVNIDVSKLGKLRTDHKLFSESNGRWIVEVKKKNQSKFEKIVKATKLGEVTSEERLVITDIDLTLDYSVEDLRLEWSQGMEREE